jgi:ribosomal peptide maturation radical SAM protein 1
MIDVLLISPPFNTIMSPSLALSNLKANFLEKKISCKIFYENLYFAKILSPEIYEKISQSYLSVLAGEFIFASCAFPECSETHSEVINEYSEIFFSDDYGDNFNEIEIVKNLQKQSHDYLERLSDHIVEERPDIVGITTNNHQICFSIALTTYIKKKNHNIITVCGGFDCWKPRGEAFLGIAPSIDYFFSGEADIEFTEFCMNAKENIYPSERIVECKTIDGMNRLPFPDFSDFFHQIKKNELDIKNTILVMEISRGCWWRNISQCIFCGSTGLYHQYRHKNPGLVKKEAEFLIKKYKKKTIALTDQILPKKFAEEYFTLFQKSKKKPSLYIALKPIEKMDTLLMLYKSGLRACQAGIETLNSRLLQILKKGNSLSHNLRFLRDCTTLGIIVHWNYLYDIPGETDDDYNVMFELIPTISHLNPPEKFHPVVIQRYSPLFEESEQFGINDLKPMKFYHYLFPKKTKFDSFAYYYEGSYHKSLDNGAMKKKFDYYMQSWLNVWILQRPVLRLIKLYNDLYLLEDTRPSFDGMSLQESKEYKILNTIHYELLKSLKNITNSEQLNKIIEKTNSLKEFEELIENRCILECEKNIYVSIVNEKIQFINNKKMKNVNINKKEDHFMRNFNKDEFELKLNTDDDLAFNLLREPKKILSENGLKISKYDEKKIFEQL